LKRSARPSQERILPTSPQSFLIREKKKDPEELERIRRACDAIHQGHEAVLSNLREGITELELAAAVEMPIA